MEPAPGMLVTPNVRLVRPLREGGMGAVWIGEHLTLKTQVAVKFISAELLKDDPGLAARFETEASLAAQIKSEHVVHTHDQGLTIDGRPYIVMELLEGNTLTEWVELMGPLSLRATVLMVTQVGKALHRAHQLGIVHRDIKADNIFLVDTDEELFVKILDFGIAKHTRLPELDRRTKPGTIVGTPEFMSPEQMLAADPVDTKADLWALGVAAYYGLTGKLAFEGTTLVALCLAVLEANPRPPSEHVAGIPPAVDEWFKRALAREPTMRHGSAREMAESLQRAARTDAEPISLEARVSDPAASGRYPAITDEPSHAATPDSGRPTEPGTPAALAGTRPTFAGAASPVQPAAPRRRRGLRTAAAFLAAIAALGAGVGAAILLERRHVLPRPPAPTATPAAVVTAEPTPTATWVMPDDGSPPGTLPKPDLVWVPAGEFVMGCNVEADKRCEQPELPTHKVTLSVFQIDRLEVSVAKYAACVKAGRCTTDGLTDSDLCNWGQTNRADHPINCVDWNQSSSYCHWVGMRLPTEAEWEKAARGDKARVYPWGSTDPSCALTIMHEAGDGCSRDSTWPVGSKPEGASPYGALDMAGNVWEWVADRFEEGYYAHSPAQDPVGPEGGLEHGQRGGSWLSKDTADLRASERHSGPVGYRNYNLGFRCVTTPSAEALATMPASSAAAAGSATAAPKHRGR